MTDTTTDLQAVVDDFNAEHSTAAWVRYWTGTRHDAPKYGITDGKAWLLGGHTPVVRVRGAASCIALTHVDVIPDQPDGIEDDSHDLPEVAAAAERVGAYIAANGDGIYDVIDGHPLYARDLEALRRAGTTVAGLRSMVAEQAAEVDRLRAELEQTRAVAQVYRSAMVSQHEWAGHLVEGRCEPCTQAVNELDGDLACSQYQAWQREYEDAVGTHLPQPATAEAVAR